MLRRFVIVGLWLISLVAAFGLGKLSLPGIKFTQPPPPPPALVQGLSKPGEAGSTELTQRVQAAFPVGSSEAEMLRSLREQDFALSKTLSKGEKEASRVDYPFRTLCGIAASVLWQSDDAGKITRIRGLYEDAGCL